MPGPAEAPSQSAGWRGPSEAALPGASSPSLRPRGLGRPLTRESAAGPSESSGRAAAQRAPCCASQVAIALEKWEPDTQRPHHQAPKYCSAFQSHLNGVQCVLETASCHSGRSTRRESEGCFQESLTPPAPPLLLGLLGRRRSQEARRPRGRGLRRQLLSLNLAAPAFCHSSPR